MFIFKGDEWLRSKQELAKFGEFLESLRIKTAEAETLKRLSSASTSKEMHKKSRKFKL